MYIVHIQEVRIQVLQWVYMHLLGLIQDKTILHCIAGKNPNIGIDFYDNKQKIKERCK